MSPEDVQTWLDGYVAAWRSYDPDAIAALFAQDATYAYRPWEDPVEGAGAIVAEWLKNPDPPDSWEAVYRPLLVEGKRAVAVGETRYANGSSYANLWELDFDDAGRCARFVEWFMEKPGT